MNLLSKLERLQETNKRLLSENDSLKKENEKLKKEMEKVTSYAKDSLDKSEASIESCKKLNLTYEESIAAAKSARAKYERLYGDCLKIKKQMLKEIKR